MLCIVPSPPAHDEDFLTVDRIDELYTTALLHLSETSPPMRDHLLNDFLTYVAAQRAKHLPWSKSAYALYELHRIVYRRIPVNRGVSPLDSVEYYLRDYAVDGKYYTLQGWKEKWGERASPTHFEPRDNIRLKYGVVGTARCVGALDEILTPLYRCCHPTKSALLNAFRITYGTQVHSFEFELFYDLTIGLLALSGILDSTHESAEGFYQRAISDSRYYYTCHHVLPQILQGEEVSHVAVALLLTALTSRGNTPKLLDQLRERNHYVKLITA